MRGFGRRFAAEVGFIVLVAVALAIANLRWPAIVLLMGAAWVLTALVEFVAWRRGRADVQARAGVVRRAPRDTQRRMSPRRIRPALAQRELALAAIAVLAGVIVLALSVGRSGDGKASPLPQPVHWYKALAAPYAPSAKTRTA